MSASVRKSTLNSNNDVLISAVRGNFLRARKRILRESRLVDRRAYVFSAARIVVTRKWLCGLPDITVSTSPHWSYVAYVDTQLTLMPWRIGLSQICMIMQTTRAYCF